MLNFMTKVDKRAKKSLLNRHALVRFEYFITRFLHDPNADLIGFIVQNTFGTIDLKSFLGIRKCLIGSRRKQMKMIW